MRASRKTVWVLQGTTVLFWASLYAYVPYLSPYLQDLGLVASVIGYVSSSYGAAMLLARIPIGVWADRMGKQKGFVLLGTVCAAAAAVGMQWTENPAGLMALRFLSGVAAATWVSFVTLYSSYFEESHTTQAVASLNLLSNLGRVLASLMGAVAAQAVGYRGPFWLGGILGILAMAVGLFATDIQGNDAPPVRVGQLLLVGRERSLLYASLLGAVIQMIAYATTYTFTNTLAQQIGAGEVELGILQAITAIAGVLAPLMLSMGLSRVISERMVLLTSFALLAVSQGLFPLCRTLPTLYATQFLSGIGLGLGMVPLMALSIRYVSTEKRSTAMGYFQAVYSLGLTAGPVIMGYLVQYLGYTAAYCVMGLLAVAAAGLSHFAYGGLERTNEMRKCENK